VAVMVVTYRPSMRKGVLVFESLRELIISPFTDNGSYFKLNYLVYMVYLVLSLDTKENGPIS